MNLGRLAQSICCFCALFSLPGCISREAGFCNATDEAVELWVSPESSPATRQFLRHLIPRWSMVIEMPERVYITAVGTDGKEWFRQHNVDVAKADEAPYLYVSPTERAITYFVDHQGIYPIPVRYTDDWPKHIDEIRGRPALT
jgi:hypothetical protein